MAEFSTGVGVDFSAAHGLDPDAGSLALQGVAPNITKDLVFGGPLSIVGTVKIKALPTNLPTQARVRLLREVDCLALRETWSDPATGSFRFDDLSADSQYIPLAQDPTGNYRAVAADRITAEVQP